MLFLIGVKDLEDMIMKVKHERLDLHVVPITKQEALAKIKTAKHVVLSMNAYKEASELVSEDEVYTANQVFRYDPLAQHEFYTDDFILCVHNIDYSTPKAVKKNPEYGNVAYFTVETIVFSNRKLRSDTNVDNEE